MTVAKRKIRPAQEMEAELSEMINHDASLTMNEKLRLIALKTKVTEEWLKRMSEPGALGLPELLEARRWEYGIVDNAFEQEAVYDRIYVWQIPRDSGETFEGTMIVKPDTVRDKDRNVTPRGIIVSAGMKALDEMRSNGIDLGHIVNFIRSSPWGMPIGTINGVEIPMLRVMRGGDLVSSEDLARLRKAGKVKTIAVETPSGVEHRIANQDGTSTAVRMPWMAEEY